ncbi:hypothetical protein VTI74DRAFT_2378 [Chaetomium olivicolor]
MASNPVSSNTRATRSRFSSPLAATNGSGATESASSRAAHHGSANGSGGAGGAEVQKQFMQRWLEPPVQVKASYQDAGLVRHGVVENMAPLGTLPKVGLFKKTAPPPAATPETTRVTKIVIKQKTAAPSTPVPAPPPPPAAPEEDETEEEDESKTEVMEDQDDEKLGGLEEDGIVGGEHHEARKTAASQRSRRSVGSSETDDEEWAPEASTQKPTARRSSSRASTEVQQSESSAGAGARTISQKDLISRVVDAAVDEALSHYRYPTAWALRTLVEENSSNQEFLDMIEKVFLQTANADTLEQFCLLVQAKKKEGKRVNKAFSYFNDQNPNFALQPPRRAPYSHLVKFDVSALRLHQHSAKSEQQQQQRKKRPAKEPEPEPEQEAEREPELPPRKKRKSGKQLGETTTATTSTRASSSKMATTNGVDDKATAETPSRKLTRVNSVSSTSSLSSARSLSPPGEAQDDGEGEGFDETPSRTSPAPRQPITTTKRRRLNAPRKSRNVSPSSAPPVSHLRSTAAAAKEQKSASSQRQSPVAEQPAADAEDKPYEMPAVIDSPLFPNLNSKKGGKANIKFPDLNIATKVGKLDEKDPRQLLRLKAKKVTTNNHTQFPVSSIRDSPTLEEQQPQEPAQATTATPAPASRLRSAVSSSRQTPAPREGRSTRSSFKRTYDELEDQPSPTTANFPGSEAASTAADSRAGTPALRPAKKARTGLRVKNSPVKKKNGTSAGIPRPSGERSSPVGAAAREDDNDDYCSSCGGNGELVCCDGCTRSFHFGCVDPVLSPDAMPVEWFCNVCRVQRDPSVLPNHRGAFASLLDKLDVKNSSAFRLPAAVRDRFEGVRTGADGEYEEIVPVVKPTTRKKKNEEDQAPDFFRTRDADGKVALCHICGEGSTSNRPILPCNQCGIFWHMDCLDPPATYPPHPRSFRCPLHADELLTKVGEALGPAHKYRKVKDAPVISPIFSRGYANNGWVDVDMDESEDETGWRDFATFGRTVRLSEKGIKLDFLSRARALREKAAVSQAPTPAPAPAPIPMQQRSVEEQQAALNLAQLSRSTGDDGISTLIDAMISEAAPPVIDLMARANATRLKNSQLSQMDQQSLRAFLAHAESLTEHIRQLLAAPQQPTVPAETTAEHAPALVPSVTPSQSPDPDTEKNSPTNMILDTDPSAMDVDVDAPKSPASPATATTDDVPAMTQGEKTPVQGDQSPAAPLRLEDSVVGAGADVPGTPTKGGAMPGEEPVVLEAGGEEGKELGVEGVDVERGVEV